VSMHLESEEAVLKAYQADQIKTGQWPMNYQHSVMFCLCVYACMRVCELPCGCVHACYR
jgi:hypothetical protein